MLPVNYVCISMHGTTERAEKRHGARARIMMHPLWRHVTEPPRTGPDFKTLESDRERERKSEKGRKRRGKKKKKKGHVEGFDFRFISLSLSLFRERNTIELTVENKGGHDCRGHGWWQNGPWLTRPLFSFPATRFNEGHGKSSAILVYLL